MKPSLVEEITQGYFLCVCRFLLVAGHKTLTLGSMEGRTLFTTPKKRRWLTGLSRDLYMGQDDSKPESLGRACVWWWEGEEAKRKVSYVSQAPSRLANLLFLFFFVFTAWLVGSYFPNQGLNPGHCTESTEF